ncbi:MAG: hypothetical protein N2747_00335 [Chitinophagaceae bacterium]|nr:hypothetical protein [Chitinophagaceae bacterium]
MYADVIQSILQRLNQIAALKYISENWGQLDFFGYEHPVKYPCVLVNIPQAAYSNLGQGVQLADATVRLTIGYQRLVNPNVAARLSMQNAALKPAYDLLAAIQALLHGFKPVPNGGPLTRQTQRNINREDGIILFEIDYRVTITDDDAMPNPQTKKSALHLTTEIIKPEPPDNPQPEPDGEQDEGNPIGDPVDEPQPEPGAEEAELPIDNPHQKGD